jgi:GNAT superfamily N-acetyltransferase
MSAASVAIRPARVEDVPLVLRFIRELAEYEGIAGQVVATEAGLREALFGTPARAEVALAWSASEPVGFVVFFHNFSTLLGRHGLHVDDLYVVPSWRGRGLGRRLLAHVARLAQERGCGRLEWWVMTGNTAARRFYEGLGAECLEGWRIQRLHGATLAELAAEG